MAGDENRELASGLSGFSLMFYLHSDPNHFSCALDILKRGPTTLVSALYCQTYFKRICEMLEVFSWQANILFLFFTILKALYFEAINIIAVSE